MPVPESAYIPPKSMFSSSCFPVYGGIYLDWDEVVLRSVDIFRNYETTMVSKTIMKTRLYNFTTFNPTFIQVNWGLQEYTLFFLAC